MKSGLNLTPRLFWASSTRDSSRFPSHCFLLVRDCEVYVRTVLSYNIEIYFYIRVETILENVFKKIIWYIQILSKYSGPRFIFSRIDIYFFSLVGLEC